MCYTLQHLLVHKEEVSWGHLSGKRVFSGCSLLQPQDSHLVGYLILRSKILLVGVSSVLTSYQVEWHKGMDGSSCRELQDPASVKLCISMCWVPLVSLDMWQPVLEEGIVMDGCFLSCEVLG